MFLVHGPIVVLFVRMMHLPLAWALGLALIVTMVTAIALRSGIGRRADGPCCRGSRNGEVSEGAQRAASDVINRAS
jgi:hypothetical protein